MLTQGFGVHNVVAVGSVGSVGSVGWRGRFRNPKPQRKRRYTKETVRDEKPSRYFVSLVVHAVLLRWIAELIHHIQPLWLSATPAFRRTLFLPQRIQAERLFAGVFTLILARVLFLA